jgi:hypothetical protein
MKEVSDINLAWALACRLTDGQDEELLDLLADVLRDNRAGMEKLWAFGVIEEDYFGEVL